MNHPKKIDTSHAEVKTATVSVKVLTINARKLTLSVFRQVKEEDLFVINGDELSLAGVPWGIVHYYWGYQSQKDLHVLWVKGGELRRSLISKDGGLYLEYKLGMKTYTYDERIRYEQYKDFCDMQYSCLTYIKKKEETHVFDDYDKVGYRNTEYSTFESEEDYQLVNNQIARFKQNAIQAKKDADEVRRRFGVLIKQYSSQYESLSQLDQLFIAV